MEKLKKQCRFRSYCDMFSLVVTRYALAVLFVFTAFSVNASALKISENPGNRSFSQEGIIVKGKVVDEEGEAIPVVAVVVQGTQQGVTTDVSGNYEIKVPSEESVLVFRYIGMKTHTVQVGKQTVINITMEVDAHMLQDVVVTALNISKAKEALGYSVQEVKAEDLNMSADNNVMTALQGKVAGVNIAVSGGLAGNSRIDIRGASSIRDDNAPLWVIDGVPFSNEEATDGSFWGGISRSGAAIDINPEDIESLTVLKGPSAAALYGSLAGNGVIMVTTKKGKRAQGMGIDLYMTTTFSKASYVLDLQHEYGQGTGGVYDNRSRMSWGPKFDGSMKEDWRGNTTPYTAQKDRIKDFTQTGVSMKYGAAVSGGTEKSRYRISAFKEDNNGITDDHEFKKLNFDIKADYDITDWLNIDTKISYIKSEGLNRPELGFYGYTAMFNKMPLNIRNSDLSPGYVMEKGSRRQILYTTVDANYLNPYFMLKQRRNFDERNRFFGYLGGLVKIAKGLKLRLRYSLDNYRYQEEMRRLYKRTPDDKGQPNYETVETFFSEENAEFLFMYDKKFSDDFSLEATFGGNMMKNKRELLRARSGFLFSEDQNFLGYGTNITAEETITPKEVHSLYGSVDLGYKDWVYLNLTGRKDWSSTLHKGEYGFFYPSANLSAVVSNMLKLPEWYDFLKVRAGVGRTGKALDPFMTSQVISLAPSTSAFGQLRPFDTGNEIYLPRIVDQDLIAEMSTSYEVGLESRFFLNRLGFELVYYREKTDNQIIEKTMDFTTGGRDYLSNIGVVENEGIELLLNTVPVKSGDFSVRADFSFAANETVVKEVSRSDSDSKLHSFFRDNDVEVVAIQGEKMGDILGTVWKRDAQGRQVVDSRGLPVRDQERKVVGNLQADWTGSVVLGVKYKGLYMNNLFDIRSGGDIMSLSERQAIEHGTAERTADNGRADFVLENSVTESGELNDKMISAEEYYHELAKCTEELMYDASYIKWKELSIGYSVPKKLLKRFARDYVKNFSVSLVGRNLLYLHKNTPGTVPDASAYSTEYFAQAFDFSPLPMTRTYGFSIKIGL
ncbi:MAG: SusC/RagA family TonB-linked outer membrane protein [Cytophagales bacterium]|nr:SusC/RagA family TonB-linked outer membrane protein [Cytophagales bacterium]